MKTIILLFALGLTSFVFAQTKDYNKATLSLFNDSNWNDLITIGEKAIKDNKSSYEIEYRLAVAYYNTNQYFDSAKHFEKIKDIYNINNEYIQEYLYYSYLLSSRGPDALLISKDFPFHLIQKTEVKKFEFIDYLSAEGGVKLSSKSDIIENIPYFNIGLGQKLGYHVNLNHSYTSLSQNYLDFDYEQKEYYLNANIHIAQGLTIIPAYHYISISENIESINRRRGSNIITTRENDEKIHLLHFAIKKQWNRFFIMPNASYSGLYKKELEEIEEKTRNNIQYGLDLGYTINGLKDKLWLGFGLNVLNDDSNNENKFIWNAKAHYQINPKIFLYLKYLNANTSNFSEDNAQYYYNSISILANKISATFDYNFTPKFSWFINYQYENNEDLENDFLFTYNTFITGLKYNF